MFQKELVKIGNSRWPPGAFSIKIENLPVDHHGGHKLGPIVFIWSKILLTVRTCHLDTKNG